ncbi:MAG TPA: zinc-dependent metalloprotease family protein, partial [Phycisphaerales bacterium]|nr:zinc-dependent metalloprotease family protein [Phycisphaerales bacterium]
MHRCGITGLLAAMALLAGSATTVRADEWPPVGPTAWETIEGPIVNDGNEAPWVQPRIYRGVLIHTDAMRNVLAGAPMEDSPDAKTAPLLLHLPRPDGTTAVFSVVESPVMHPDLAAQFPDIKTYVGQGVDQPEATIRLDITPLGFHAQVLAPGGSWYIDPFFDKNTLVYTSHFKRDLDNTHNFTCQVPDAQEMVRREHGGGSNTRAIVTRKRYRLANACTGEYAAKFGGTVAGAQAAIVTAVNRVTGVYENEVGVRLELVANNTNVVYTNSSTDPYTNNDGGAMLNQNITACNGQIGSGNYDIGHVFSTGGGGVAGLGVVCTSSKAWGVTGSANPTGDAFWIDYVAHEMGHQFGGNHNFNGTGGSCSGNRNGSTAYEIGSGTTIMSYAGICSGDDIQSHSDPYFGFGSITEITTFINSGSGNNCDVPTTTTNNTPVVSAGPSFTIPHSTPFQLTPDSYSDADGDPLTFSWEERDLGAAQTATAADNGASPLFRPFAPTTNPTRLVPQLSNILSGTLTKGEKWATTNRAVKWRVTVRDNQAGEGGTGFSDRTINVVNTAGPFSITTANSTTVWQGNATQTVAWNVANTTASPISTANVRILFSTDNGATFPTVLAASTPNDGSENITVPNVNTTNGRIKVEAIGNIYFDINNVRITVQAVTAPSDPTNVTATPPTVCQGSQTSLSCTVGSGIEVDWYSGSCGVGFVGTGNPLVVTPSGNTTYYARARRTSDGQVSSGCGSVSVTVTSLPTAPTSAATSDTNFCPSVVPSITLTASGGSGSTLRWYTDACGGSLVGSGSPLVIASPSVTTTYYARWESSCGFSSCASV